MRLFYLRLAQRFQLFHLLYLEGCQTLTFRLVSLDGDKLFDINLFLSSEGIAASIGDEQTWIVGVGQQDLLRVRILASIVLFAFRCLHEESFDVGISLIVCIVEHTAPNLVGFVFLQVLNVVFKVVVRVEVGQVVVTILQDDQNLIAIVKLA